MLVKNTDKSNKVLRPKLFGRLKYFNCVLNYSFSFCYMKFKNTRKVLLSYLLLSNNK